MDIILRTTGSLAILFIGFWLLFLAPSWIRDALEYVFQQIQFLILWIINTSIKTVNYAVHISHWLGRVFVVAIFISAAIALIDNIATVFQIEFLDRASKLFQLTLLFENKITWVASTAIVATTVALGHFKTIDFNYEKHRHERLEKYREKRENTKPNATPGTTAS